jgi:hypothetical protein
MGNKTVHEVVFILVATTLFKFLGTATMARIIATNFGVTTDDGFGSGKMVMVMVMMMVMVTVWTMDMGLSIGQRGISFSDWFIFCSIHGDINSTFIFLLYTINDQRFL